MHGLNEFDCELFIPDIDHVVMDVENWQYSRVTLLPIQSTRAEDAQQEALV
jgi:hypothetical protein